MTEVKTCLAEAKTQVETIEEQKKSIDKFLDCFFKVDVPPTPNKLEWRLVRGHAVVAMLAMYGAFSLKHDPVNQEEDAQRLFGRIVEAENSLWAASKLKPRTQSPASEEVKILLNDAARHDRIIDVGQVATAALKPLKRRLFGFFEKLGAVFVAPTPGGVIGVLKDVREAAKRAFVIALKGSDYIRGTREWMKRIKTSKSGQPDISDWNAIDEAFLIPACRSVAFMAFEDFRRCSPDRTQQTAKGSNETGRSDQGG